MVNISHCSKQLSDLEYTLETFFNLVGKRIPQLTFEKIKEPARNLSDTTVHAANLRCGARRMGVYVGLKNEGFCVQITNKPTYGLAYVLDYSSQIDNFYIHCDAIGRMDKWIDATVCCENSQHVDAAFQRVRFSKECPCNLKKICNRMASALEKLMPDTPEKDIHEAVQEAGKMMVYLATLTGPIQPGTEEGVTLQQQPQNG